MRRHDFTRGALALLFLTASACGGLNADLQVEVPTDAPQVTVSLSYTRPVAYRPTGRPAAFEVIRDYTSSTTLEEYTGTWDDQAQTLTASIRVALRAENLVYVIDEAVPGGIQTPMFLPHVGQLHEISCTPDVPPGHPCYLLQVLN